MLKILIVSENIIYLIIFVNLFLTKEMSYDRIVLAETT